MKKNHQNAAEKKQITSKTLAKAMGLKSALVFDDRLVLTSFAKAQKNKKGEANHSRIEKDTDWFGVESKDSRAETPPLFQADIDKNTILLVKGKEQTYIPNPADFEKGIGRDYIGLKKCAEEIFFGENFLKDNIHVQIAYNILDIKKILGTYINNIIYIFFNLIRGEDKLDEESFYDLIGMIFAFNDMDEQKKFIETEGKKQDKETYDLAIRFLRNTAAYVTYFGSAFERINPYPKSEAESMETKKEYGDEEASKKKLSNNYDTLRLLSLVRQLTMHGAMRSELTDSSLYNLKVYLNTNNNKLLEKLDQTFKDSVKELNASFTKHAGKNLYILKKIYSNESIQELTDFYYRLTVRKEDLNQGVNLKKLREEMVKNYLGQVMDSRFDTYRNKIYTVLNFILLKTLMERADILENMVQKLRANIAGEEGKEKLYKEFAGKVWLLVEGNYRQCLYLFEKESASHFSNELTVPEVSAEWKFSSDNVDYFVKLLFFICQFLDGKEINELLCAIINKFENIADILDSAERCGNPVKFVSDYVFFENSRQLAVQFALAKNVALKGFRKKKKDEKIKANEGFPEVLYIDALALLGYGFKKYMVEDITQIPQEKREEYYTQEYKDFRRIFFETKKGKIEQTYQGKSDINHKARNFIANNILNSKRFFYIVKYCNPAKCGVLMQNEMILRIVMENIPEDQIGRYYKAVNGGRVLLLPQKMKEELIERLTKFSVKDEMEKLLKISESRDKKQDSSIEKEKMKALVGLYLTAAYLLTKSMVKVNTRFNIAFSVLERDYYLLERSDYLQKGKKLNTNKLSGEQMFRLTDKFLNNDERVYDSWKVEYDRIRGKYDVKVKDENGKPYRGAVRKVMSEEDKAAMRRNDEKLHKMHYSVQSYCYIVKNSNEVEKRKDNKGNKKTLAEQKEKVMTLESFKQYRNAVAHLNIITAMPQYLPDYRPDEQKNTYYGLYCYCLQRYLCENNQSQKDAYLNALAEWLEQNHRYDKKAMWVLNLPFAYNLARYKNLSNEKLFYDEEAVAEKADKAENERGE